MKSGIITRTALLILAIAGLIFAGCKKDKSAPGTPGNPGNTTKKLSRIEENGNTTATLEYNTDGTLKKLTTTFSPTISTTFSFTYDTQKRPLIIASDDDYTIKYVYINNVLELTENYDGQEKVSENRFDYENGKIKANTLFTAFPQPGGNIIYRPTFRTAYTYYNNGAVQKISTYTLNQATQQLELEYEYVYQQYDDKKNPLAVIADFSQVLMYQPIHINNPIIEKLYNPNGGVDETTQNAYTYDAAGYPLTCTSTTTVTGGSPTVRETKFFY